MAKLKLSYRAASLFGLFSLAALPVIFVCFFSFKIADDLLTSEIQTTLAVFTQKKAHFIDNYIHERKLNVQQLAILPVVTQLLNDKSVADTPDFQLFFKDFLRQAGFKRIYILDNKGTLLFSNDGSIKTPLTMKQLDDTQQYIKSLYQLSITLLATDVILGERIQKGLRRLFITTPIFEKGRLKGALIVSLKDRAFHQELLQSISLGEALTYVSARIKGNTKVLFSNKKDKLALNNQMSDSLKAILTRAAKGDNGITYHTTAEGNQDLVVYRYVPQLNMGLVTNYPAALIQEKSVWVKKRLIFLLVAGIVVIFSLLYTLYRRFEESEQKSNQLAHRLVPQKALNQLGEEVSLPIVKRWPKTTLLYFGFENLPMLNDTEDDKNLANNLMYLNDEIDLLLEMYHVTKLSQYGGEYYFIVDNEQHPIEDALNFALALLNGIHHYNVQHDTQFIVKLAATSGPVSSGLMNSQRYSHDLWGDGVNSIKAIAHYAPRNALLVTTEILDSLDDKSLYNYCDGPVLEFADAYHKTYIVKISERLKTS